MFPVAGPCGKVPRVMGILNVTPDSFSDGGLHQPPQAALVHARRMMDEGAHIIEVGGESTRPGAMPISVQEELDRVMPVVESVVSELGARVSVDTSRPEVMRAAAASGAFMVNDVRALQVDGALAAATECGLTVCLMHMQGQPASMQSSPDYDDVVSEVLSFLDERRQACLQAGIRADAVLVDPGFGFGKTLAHNIALLKGLGRFVALAPVLAGLSRKGMIGSLIGDPAAERVHGSVTAALLAVQRGAAVVRVHDVGPTVRALAVQQAIDADGLAVPETIRWMEN